MLENLKLLLGIESNDKDALLKQIIASATARLQVLLGGIEPPDSLEYIIIDVSIRRFNRIGSEGMTSHTVEGESISFADNDFVGYEEDIKAYLDTQNGSARGRVRFL